MAALQAAGPSTRREGVPITLIIDDPAPLVNVFWWHAADSQKTDHPTQQSGEPVARDVPTDFLEEFAEVIARWGVRGKFSVLPYPAGLGKISEGWPGADPSDLRRWNRIARERVMPFMDITPEILTHAKAVDIDTLSLLAENERDWASHQTAATLTPYIACALRLLNEVGLEATGVTSPWDFGREVEPDYRAAIRRAMKEVNRRGQTWYFLHTSSRGTEFLSQVVHREGDDWLVSLVSQAGDFLWRTMETKEAGPEVVRSVADLHLTEDGRNGRLAELFHAGTPIVFHTHWQSLYSNGRRTGLKALEEVGRRIARAWGAGARWVTCDELAREIAAGQAHQSNRVSGSV
ncbi:MAG: hypothetical protein HYU36_18915 [Planctomycetes bacterium]|nr:hypothetical protein [Planctomycetota bacterium]